MDTSAVPVRNASVPAAYRAGLESLRMLEEEA